MRSGEETAHLNSSPANSLLTGETQCQRHIPLPCYTVSHYRREREREGERGREREREGGERREGDGEREREREKGERERERGRHTLSMPRVFSIMSETELAGRTAVDVSSENVLCQSFRT